MRAFRAAHAVPHPEVSEAERERRLQRMRVDIGGLEAEGIIQERAGQITVPARGRLDPLRHSRFAGEGLLESVGPNWSRRSPLWREPQGRNVTAATLVLMIAFAASSEVAHSQSPDAAAIVERAGRYVQAFEQDFSAVVCEERQTQALVRPDGSARKQREIRSDFLLVKVGTSGLQAFRDVIEVDRKPIRNREDRLRKLFLGAPETAMEQAKAIAKESARYNIGVSRSVTSPFTPLQVLVPRIASGFHFTLAGTLLTFDEFRSPSLFRHRSGGVDRDMLSRGSFAIDADTGRVLEAELTAGGPPPTFSTRLSTRYEENAALGLLVPVEMQERIWQPHRPKDDHLEVTSSYSNFRRFQVTVDEQIEMSK